MEPKLAGLNDENVLATGNVTGVVALSGSSTGRLVGSVSSGANTSTNSYYWNVSSCDADSATSGVQDCSAVDVSPASTGELYDATYSLYTSGDAWGFGDDQRVDYAVCNRMFKARTLFSLAG